MIGFNALGQLGRLGNQMFQFAALKGIARHHDYQFCFPPPPGYGETIYGAARHELLSGFKMGCTNELNIQYIDPDRPTVSESSFSFDQNIFNNCPDWVSIHGFFQTEKYFKDIRNEIRKDFEFKDEIKQPCSQMMSNVENPVALHVRRTDYITNPNHTCLSMDYYKKALSYFDVSPVLIFSDDPDWCKEHELFADDRFMVSEGNDKFIDLCLMSMCDGHIIANSSFSWWGAWLSNSRKIIAPSGWFEGSNNSYLDTTDIYCSGWTVL